jgi:hypothetical protein
MNNQPEIYFNIQSRLFPMVEEEIGELTEKQQKLILYLTVAENPQKIRILTPRASFRDTIF